MAVYPKSRSGRGQAEKKYTTAAKATMSAYRPNASAVEGIRRMMELMVSRLYNYKTRPPIKGLPLPAYFFLAVGGG